MEVLVFHIRRLPCAPPLVHCKCSLYYTYSTRTSVFTFNFVYYTLFFPFFVHFSSFSFFFLYSSSNLWHPFLIISVPSCFKILVAASVCCPKLVKPYHIWSCSFLWDSLFSLFSLPFLLFLLSSYSFLPSCVQYFSINSILTFADGSVLECSPEFSKIY